MSKYSSLPDIDTSPDVFESSPPPSPPIRPASPINSSIPKEILLSKFRNSIVETRGIDFEQQVGYVAFESSSETVQEKISRIKGELEGILATCDSNHVDFAEMKLLAHRIQQAQLGKPVVGKNVKLEERRVQENLMKKIRDVRQASVSLEKPIVPQDAMILVQSQEESKRIEVESRMAKLESKLGILSDASLSSRLAILEEQVSFASNPSNVEMVLQKLSALAEMGKSDGRKELEFNKNVKQAIDVFENVHPVLNTLPNLIVRLKTLHTMHTQLAGLTDVSKDVQQRQDDLDKNVDELKVILERVSKSLASNVDVTRSATATLQARLDTLLAKK
jgi:hypothetical protein